MDTAPRAACAAAVELIHAHRRDPGKDLSHVAWQFLYWLLTEGGFEERDHSTVKAAVRQCTDVLVPLANFRPVNKKAAEDAATMAWAAAETAAMTATAPVRAAWMAESAASTW